MNEPNDNDVEDVCCRFLDFVSTKKDCMGLIRAANTKSKHIHGKFANKTALIRALWQVYREII